MRFAFILVALLALPIVAAACGDDNGDGGDDGPPPIENELDRFTTPNGVEVIVFAEGSDDAPAMDGDVVQVHYTGWLEDGTQFDSSVERGEPLTFQLGRGEVIEGWDEGIEGMSAGEERRLIIPPELGYGEQGSGDIPPNATLIFDVELLLFGRPPTPAPAPTVVEGENSFRTEGGVLVVVMQEGDGSAEAEPGDTLSVHYTGWLDDGTQFDSSRGGDPFPVVLGTGQVIPGWEEGLEGMSPGEIRQLVIPPELAYGEEGFSDQIPPNATLTFEVELVTLEKGAG